MAEHGDSNPGYLSAGWEFWVAIYSQMVTIGHSVSGWYFAGKRIGLVYGRYDR
jgi:hypothetical protein